MIYDISMTIHEDMQTYKNNKQNKPQFNTNATHQKDGVHDTSVLLNLHTGTHIDYPLHMIDKGATSDTENLAPLLGSCRVIDFTSCKGKITKRDLLLNPIEKGDFILLKTTNSFSENFIDDFVYLTKEASKYLVEQEVRGVGTDGLGIERAQAAHPTHKILLSNNVVILEGLRLKEVPEGNYELLFLPLKIKGVEASLGRAILRTL